MKEHSSNKKTCFCSLFDYFSKNRMHSVFQVEGKQRKRIISYEQRVQVHIR